MINEEKSFRFLDWPVYKDAKNLFKSVLKITNRLPKNMRFELTSQLIRASSSIALNIAEGSGKSSDAELNRFFNISIGSVNETLAILDILRENSFITDKEFNQLYLELQGITKQLWGFKKKLT